MPSSVTDNLRGRYRTILGYEMLLCLCNIDICKIILLVVEVFKYVLHFRSICECWKTLASDSQLSTFALDHLLKILTSSELFDDLSPGSSRPKVAAAQPLAVSIFF